MSQCTTLRHNANSHLIPCRVRQGVPGHSTRRREITCSARAKRAGRYADADELQLQGKEAVRLGIAGGLLAPAPRQRTMRSRCRRGTEGAHGEVCMVLCMIKPTVKGFQGTRRQKACCHAAAALKALMEKFAWLYV